VKLLRHWPLPGDDDGGRINSAAVVLPPEQEAEQEAEREEFAAQAQAVLTR
jgi:hypothetical protein